MAVRWRREKRQRNLYEVQLAHLRERLDEAVGENIGE